LIGDFLPTGAAGMLSSTIGWMQRLLAWRIVHQNKLNIARIDRRSKQWNVPAQKLKDNNGKP
jgi:hypothetical protein